MISIMNCKKPQREIFVISDMTKWAKSKAYHDYVEFILSLNQTVMGKSNKLSHSVNDNVQSVINILNKLDDLTDRIPPINQPQRFGNRAFQIWYSKCKELGESLLADVIPQEFHIFIPELACYLTESFGNSNRIDYGTGHEMSFVMLLCCFHKIGLLKHEDKLATVCLIFEKYLHLVRKLQLLYRMEPAGSHGAWSLDDYQFLPFLWGSSQLIGHPRLDTNSFIDENITSKYSADYMFMGSIQFIFKVKKGPFAEHSNQLWNISAVPTWEKINQGLIRMYKNEVLGKFPVIQHTLFGSLLSIEPVKKMATAIS